MTYTPGPWRAIFEPYEDGTPYFRFRGGDAFADRDVMGFQFTAIIRPADARLIAAAPDLVAALTELVAPFAMVSDETLSEFPDVPQPTAILKARAALAKAGQPI